MEALCHGSVVSMPGWGGESGCAVVLLWFVGIELVGAKLHIGAELHSARIANSICPDPFMC